MKRHTCIICHQKRKEEELIKVVHVGKNGVAYSGWVCKANSYRRDSKNYNNWSYNRKKCEYEFNRMEKENKDFSRDPGKSPHSRPEKIQK